MFSLCAAIHKLQDRTGTKLWCHFRDGHANRRTCFVVGSSYLLKVTHLTTLHRGIPFFESPSNMTTPLFLYKNLAAMSHFFLFSTFDCCQSRFWTLNCDPRWADLQGKCRQTGLQVQPNASLCTALALKIKSFWFLTSTLTQLSFSLSASHSLSIGIFLY